MNLRRLIAFGVILALASVVMVFVRRHDSIRSAAASPAPAAPARPKTANQNSHSAPALQPPSPVPPAREDLEGQPALVAPRVSELSTTDRPPLANGLGAPTTKPEAEPAIVLEVLDAYRRAFGAYPAGENNSQLVNALLGANQEKLPFIPHDHPRLNAQGEIVDAWGTPFFFHQNSRTAIEVRSAGADRRLFTDDDIVVGKTPSQPKQPTILTVPAPAG